MPGYGAGASAFWLALFAAGVAIIWYSSWQVGSLPEREFAQVLAGAVIAALVGRYPVRVPGTGQSIAVSDVFTFLLLLLHGPAAAVFCATTEAAVSSWRSSKNWSNRFACPAAAAVAMFTCGILFEHTLGLLGGAGFDRDITVLAVLILLAVAYVAVNTALIAAMNYLRRAQRPSSTGWLRRFGWVGIAYAASASVAGLFFVTSQEFGVPTLVAAVALVSLFLAMVQHLFGRSPGTERARSERVEVA